MPAIEPSPSLFHPVLLCDSNLIPSQGVNSNNRGISTTPVGPVLTGPLFLMPAELAK